jgi:hypothetical protein
MRLVFGFRCVRIRFDGDLHLSTRFQADFVAVFIVQRIFDPNLSI